jgi:hypothetical protein
MIIEENEREFKHLEKEIFNYCCGLGCKLLKEALESLDTELMLQRDRRAYRHKGTRKSVVKTVMGEVEYQRAVYEVRNEDGTKRFVYLLDEAMGKSGSGFMSGLLSEQIVQASCETTYRGAARSISELTGQSISHTAAWNVVQELGKRLDAQEKQAVKQAVSGKGTGELEAKVLFEEQDGIWLKMQGKSRKAHGPGKEMKLAIAYDGAKKAGKNRYELTNKVACANFEGVENFVKRKEGVIASVYNTDEIEMRFLGGDGATWVRRSQTDETVHFQLDQFHRNKAVLQYVADPEARKVIMKLLYEKELELLFAAIEGYAQISKDEKEQENYLQLLSYFQNNKDGLVPCYRRGLEMPEPPAGKLYRRLGAMESNIFTIIGNRMKGRRACWSIDGGNNLARLLCLKFTGRLSDKLHKLTSCVLPERYAEEVPLKLPAAKVPVREGKGYNGFHQMLVPSTMKWLKGLASPGSLTGI